MKRFIFILLVLLLASCNKNTVKPVVDENTIALSSQIYGSNLYYVYGYSFELGKAVSSLDNKQVADITPTQILHPDGSVLGARLSASVNNTYGFHKEGNFGSLQEATNFYDAFHEVDDTSWKSLTDTLAPFQVYAFKTYQADYVKFMITGVNIVAGVTSQDSYVEIGLKYLIQRDGTNVFGK